MSDLVPVRRALLSVSDKSDLIPFAKALVRHGIDILSTGGTAKALRDADVPVTDVADVTDFPEIMDGRVKTLNPLIYGGILNRIGIDDDIQKEFGMINLDLMVINLYPFEETISGNNLGASSSAPTTGSNVASIMFSP